MEANQRVQPERAAADDARLRTWLQTEVDEAEIDDEMAGERVAEVVETHPPIRPVEPRTGGGPALQDWHWKS